MIKITIWSASSRENINTLKIKEFYFSHFQFTANKTAVSYAGVRDLSHADTPFAQYNISGSKNEIKSMKNFSLE
ncbi:hypothetical protein AT251_03695 [Enterovibrio nigricans]|nr:hypothetical protein AT251_03695 [Enterovibrio nigricans]